MDYRRKKTSKQIKADAEISARLAEAMANADHFTTTIYSNGGYVTERSGDLAAARDKRAAIEQRINNGRKALIYCVTKDAMTHLVPDSYQP